MNRSPLPIYGHILIFIDSIENISFIHHEIEEMLTKRNNHSLSNFQILELHSKTDEKNNNKIMEKLRKTKIILATKIAECSITIDGVSVVIDSGYTIEKVFNPEHRITYTEQQFISKSQAIQRKGRAGRTQDGVCYRIYSQEDFNKMKDEQEADFLKTNQDIVILKILRFGIQNLMTFDLLERASE